MIVTEEPRNGLQKSKNRTFFRWPPIVSKQLITKDLIVFSDRLKQHGAPRSYVSRAHNSPCLHVGHSSTLVSLFFRGRSVHYTKKVMHSFLSSPPRECI
jgi:hypothetical protein